MLAREGFDPPTSGLWAQHASSASPRYTYDALYFIYKALNLKTVGDRIY